MVVRVSVGKSIWVRYKNVGVQKRWSDSRTRGSVVSPEKVVLCSCNKIVEFWKELEKRIESPTFHPHSDSY